MIIIILTCIFDAFRDGFIDSPDWLKRHIAKWLAFGIPIVYIIYLEQLTLTQIILLAIICWSAWQFIINVILKKNWESVIIRVIKWLLISLFK